MIKNTSVQSLGEVKEILESLGKEEKEENKRAKDTLVYSKKFSKAKHAAIKEMKGALQNLNIIKLNQKSIAKIIDLMPEDAEDVKKIFVGEDVALDQDEINAILEVVKKRR